MQTPAAAMTEDASRRQRPTVSQSGSLASNSTAAFVHSDADVHGPTLLLTVCVHAPSSCLPVEIGLHRLSSSSSSGGS